MEIALTVVALALVVVGLASYVHVVAEVTLSSEMVSSEMVLVGFLPPLLYAAAIRTSWVEFGQNERPIALLSLSTGRHASAHREETEQHPVVRSFEPGEAWRWCFVDQRTG